jgi:hypothetical protein
VSELRGDDSITTSQETSTDMLAITSSSTTDPEYVVGRNFADQWKLCRIRLTDEGRVDYSHPIPSNERRLSTWEVMGWQRADT